MSALVRHCCAALVGLLLVACKEKTPAALPGASAQAAVVAAPASAHGPPRAWPVVGDPSSARFEGEIRAFEAADREHPPAPGSTVFVGGSSFRLWTTLADDFKSYRVLNRGFGGARIRDVITFGRRIVLPYAPPRIVFFAGSNDINSGASAAIVLDHFRTFATGVFEVLPKTRIAFVSITTSPSRFGDIATVREANRLIRAYAAEEPRIAFIDVFPVMLDAAGRPRPELYLDDELHPTQAAYARWVPLIEPFLRD